MAVIRLACDKFMDLAKGVFSHGLPTSPAQLLDMEVKLHQDVCRECVDTVVASVLQAAHESRDVAIEAAVLASAVPHLRLQKSAQAVAITLYGGSTTTLNTRYYLTRHPTRGGPRRKKGQRGKRGNGLYCQLACLGIHYRVTPALACDVGRLVALGTVQEAVEALATRGVLLDGKTVSRLAQSLGERGLRYREWLQRREEVSSNGWAKGRRLAIAIDGGRLRTRTAKKGPRRKSGHHGFTATWREPKVITVYAIDARGRKLKNVGMHYDATLQDADGIFAVLAALLRRLGANEAKEWIVLADGAPWIWERIESLIKDVGFEGTRVTQVLDFYHACEHLSEAASVVAYWTENDQKVWYGRLRWLLRSGAVDKMIEEVEDVYSRCKPADAERILNYFRTHRARMNYASFRRRGIPTGSGAVESAVRRIVNLRLKGNGIFWCPENAEAVLHMRAQLLSGTWREFVSRALEHEALWGTADSTLEVTAA